MTAYGSQGAVRIVIADDHRLMLDALARALSEAPDIEVLGTTDSGAHVVPLVSRLQPDLVLMDVRMPGMDGLTCLDRLRKLCPEVLVVLISATGDSSEVADALRRGAAGWIVKSIDPSDLAAALRQVWRGTAFFPPAGSLGARDEVAVEEAGLTPREVEILRALVAGRSNKQIAAEQWVTEQTVKFHLTNVYRKLGVSARTGAVAWATTHGVVAQPEAEPAPA